MNTRNAALKVNNQVEILTEKVIDHDQKLLALLT